jgi:hypothetical protein
MLVGALGRSCALAQVQPFAVAAAAEQVSSAPVVTIATSTRARPATVQRLSRRLVPITVSGLSRTGPLILLLRRWSLVGPAFIEFGQDGTGHFALIAVEGWTDCRHAPHDGAPGVEFSWEGGDDGDPACGRGWAALGDDGALRGRIYFHHGDDSSFQAARVDDDPKLETSGADSYASMQPTD